jgi:hypothetical protein
VLFTHSVVRSPNPLAAFGLVVKIAKKDDDATRARRDVSLSECGQSAICGVVVG